MRRALPILLLFSFVARSEESASTATANDFSGDEGRTAFVFRRKGKAADPSLKDGRMQTLFGRSEHKTSVAFERTASGESRRIEATFRVSLSGQNEGFSFALLHTGRFDTKGAAWDPQPTRKTPPEALRTPDWAEPNLWDSLAIGFDTWSPKDEDWFNANGNFYGRPEREVSLHWDGREIANVLCPTELATGELTDIRVVVEFVTGGAEVTVHVGETRVYERRFIPHVLPYESRAAFGFHGKGEAFLDDVRVGFEALPTPMPAPISVEALRKAWAAPGRGLVKREVDLLPQSVEVDRIVLTVTYSGPMQRDYWDRGAAVYAWDEEGTRFEICRVTTPFMLWDTAYRYDVDVTHLAPLLQGRRTLAIMVGSNVGCGFLVDVSLTYYRRPAGAPRGPEVLKLENLWTGRAHFNKAGHVKEFFAQQSVSVPEGAKRAFVRICVSGHGIMEFTKLGRTLTVNGKDFKNMLWKTDCYLNPQRPQFGTWKFDRAGWAPGAIVEPWVTDVSDLLQPGGTLTFDYAPDPFEAEKWADHWVEAQVILLD